MYVETDQFERVIYPSAFVVPSRRAVGFGRCRLCHYRLSDLIQQFLHKFAARRTRNYQDRVHLLFQKYPTKNYGELRNRNVGSKRG